MLARAPPRSDEKRKSCSLLIRTPGDAGDIRQGGSIPVGKTIDNINAIGSCISDIQA
jgi:hypothetical protein